MSLLVRGGSPALSCPHCGSPQLSRLFSTFALHKTYKDTYEDILSDRQLIRRMEANDPKALAEWNRKMSRGMDSEETEPEYKEMLEKMEQGEMPSPEAVPAAEEAE